MRSTLKRISWLVALVIFGGLSIIHADTLSLKSGETVVGTYTGGNQNEVVFNVNGVPRRFSVRDVRTIEFGPLRAGVNAPPRAGVNTPRRWRIIDNSWVHFVYPANWQASDEGDRIFLSPSASRGFRGYGYDATQANVIVGMHREWGSPVQGLRGRSDGSLEGETQKILNGLGGMMRSMRRVGGFEELQFDGERALRTSFTSIGRNGVRQFNWLVTSMHPQGVLYMVFSSPEEDFPDFEAIFEQMQDSSQIVR